MDLEQGYDPSRQMHTPMLNGDNIKENGLFTGS